MSLLEAGRPTSTPVIDLTDQVLNPAPGHHIQHIDLLNPFNPKEFFDDKLSILDIKARDQSGRCDGRSHLCRGIPR